MARLKFPSYVGGKMIETTEGSQAKVDAFAASLGNEFLKRTTDTLSGDLTVTGDIINKGQLQLTISSGTAPMVVTSTTKVTNLNADMVDGYNLNQDLQKSSSPTFSKLTLSQSTGTPPLTVTSTTKVNNLNADYVDGFHMDQDLRKASSVEFKEISIAGNGKSIAHANLANGWLRIGNSLSIDENEIYFGSDAYIGTVGAYNLEFRTNGSLRSILTSAGRLGLGTSSPSARFHIDNESSTISPFFVNTRNTVSTMTIFQHSGESSPDTLFSIKKTGDSNATPDYGMLKLSKDTFTNGAGVNLYFELDASNGSGVEYGGIGAVIVDSTSGAEKGDLVFRVKDENLPRNEVMRLTHQGYLGVGTSSPNVELDIRGYINASGLRIGTSGAPEYGKIDIQSNGGSEGIQIGSAGSTFRIYRSSDNSLGLITRGGVNERGIAVGEDGYVGIGTGSTPPTSRLEIKGGDLNFNNHTLYGDAANNRIGIGTNTPASTLHIEEDQSGAVFNALQLKNNATATGTATKIIFTESTNSSYASSSVQSIRTGNQQYALTFHTTSHHSEAHDLERVRINHEGLVGIGTTSPNALLDVAGSFESDTLETKGDATIGGNLRVLGSQIGLGNQEDFIVLNDGNSHTKENYYSGNDLVTLKVDSSVPRTVLETGHVDVVTAYASEKIGTGKFAMEFNEQEESLDFIYYG